MSHHLYNSTVIPEIIELISKHYGIDEKIAMEDACKIEHFISEETFEAIKRTHGKNLNL